MKHSLLTMSLLVRRIAAAFFGFSTFLIGQSQHVDSRKVIAHERFLSSDALQGRGSATRDEQIAAVYVGSQFESFHLAPAPGSKSFVQKIDLTQPKLEGHAHLMVSNRSMEEQQDFRVLASTGESVSGALIRVKGMPVAGLRLEKGSAALLELDDVSPNQVFTAVMSMHSKGVELMLIHGSKAVEQQLSGMPVAIRSRYADGTDAVVGIDIGTILVLNDQADESLVGMADGTKIAVTITVREVTTRSTFNAVGYLPGLDKDAGTLLLSAHLDHLGVGKPVDGDSIYNGADDDAAGTTAVLELARILSTGPRLRRSILFICYGSEELGGYGDTWFLHHLPIPKNQIVANIEFEMIGMQDPKLPKGFLTLTGWERSNLGPGLRQHGANLGPDPYPEQKFFERSDNYVLAKEGVIAQTAAGYGKPPFYHQPNDDLAHLEVAFMTSALESLVSLLRWLANSKFRPQWNSGMKP